ncbi:MAG: protein serine/threonine phosphatase [Acidobacteria bacterium]|nr:protein serine/threonine phosphatase [Acidobacteriota bacterium]
MPLRAYGLTDKGHVRPTNEDCFAIHEELGLCVIADGMGGHNAGEVAARLAVDAVVDYVASSQYRCRAGVAPVGAGEDPAPWPFGFDPSFTADGNLLRTAIHLADVQIREAAFASHDYAGMGTTIVAARISEGRLSVAHVGDSRLYLVAGGALRQLTQDDSWVVSMLAHDPDTDPLLLEHHPMRNALTNVVGARSRTEVHLVEQTLTGGERLLLSTDGVHGVLDERRIARVMLEEDDPRAMAHGVVNAALARGSRDNCTAVVAVYSRR